ncbi:phage major capsid protein [Aerococcaceae bacterium NML210727]|nr:phage major capsid protein [Aerococcaceae bacterium NML210727]MCW6655079.1 phage major capsid protein [Aerococcaceae bacterium NML201296]
MAIKFKDSVRDTLIAKMGADNATVEQQVDAMLEVFDTFEKQVKAEYEELKNETDNVVLMNRGIHVLTAAETKFYNEVAKTGGLETGVIWPETILERVFQDLQEDRPLLKIINFMPSTTKTKIIRSRRKGKAVFGQLHKDIEGQLDAEFDAVEFTQLALTAFFVVSNDTLELGPRWVDRFVRLCLKEAIADAWEEALITGDGDDKPIGLLRNPDEVGFPQKDSTGTLTFKDSATMVKEMASVLKTLSEYTHKIGKNDKTGVKKQRKVANKIYLIVNPKNYYDIVARTTTQNANGVFVTNIPFIAQERIIESVHVPENKLIAFVEREYDATNSRAEKLYVYKETFAMRRATLYAVDMVGNGRPTNNDAAKVYDINIPSE